MRDWNNNLIQNNESLQEQADAMRDSADTTAKRAYDHMFAAIPIFDGTKPELFNDWLESIETLCEESGRDIRTEGNGTCRSHSSENLKSIPANKRWSIQGKSYEGVCLTYQQKHMLRENYKLLSRNPKKILELSYIDLPPPCII